MRFTSLAIQDLLAVLPEVAPQLDDVRPVIPQTFQPTFTPQRACRISQLSPTRRDDSFFIGTSWSYTNVAGAVTPIAILAKGVWRITGSFQYAGTICATMPDTVVTVVQNATTIGVLARFRQNSLVAVNGAYFIDTQLTVDVDTTFNLSTPTMGVAEANVGSLGWLASRIM